MDYSELFQTEDPYILNKPERTSHQLNFTLLKEFHGIWEIYDSFWMSLRYSTTTERPLHYQNQLYAYKVERRKSTNQWFSNWQFSNGYCLYKKTIETFYLHDEIKN